MLDSILTNGASMPQFLLCMAVSLILGAVIAGVYMFRNTCSKQFAITLALLPLIVQVAITMVGGNVGTGIAVAGTFSLVRFRSVPGDGKDICSVFLAMVAGLVMAGGYIGIAVLLTVVTGAMSILYTITPFGETGKADKELIVTIPENLDYTGIFDDLFSQYTSKNELVRVKTSNMGSVYKLTYFITLKSLEQEKTFLDELRCRNGNLDIVCGRRSSIKTEL